VSAGAGGRYDLSKSFHPLGYAGPDLRAFGDIDRYSWYASTLFTF
jgi:hypothetical protein